MFSIAYERNSCLYEGMNRCTDLKPITHGKLSAVELDMLTQRNWNILKILEACLVKTGFTASAKSIDSGQPAQSAQADLSRYFLCFGYRPISWMLGSSLPRDFVEFQTYMICHESPLASLMTFFRTSLTLSLTTIFLLFQTERVCRRQF